MARKCSYRGLHGGLVATAGFAIAGVAHADMTGISASAAPISQSGWQAPDGRSLVLVSLWAEFDDPTDRLIAVYGDATDPMSIGTSDDSGFWNFDADGSQSKDLCNTSSGIAEALMAAYPSQASDSFVTIGLTTSTDNAIQVIGLNFDDFNEDLAAPHSLESDNGAYFCTPSDDQTVAGNYTDNKVLIGQFAIGAGETVFGSVNIQWNTGAGDTTSDTGLSFVATAVIANVAKDLEGDGFDDLILQRDDHQRVRGLMGSGGGLVAAALSSGDWSGWTIIGTGDVTGDGTAEILVQRDDRQRLGYYAWDGMNLSYTKFNSGNLSDWNVVGIGDLDGNGQSDIVIQKVSGANAYRRLGVYKMSGGTASYQTLPPRGDLSNWNILGCGDMNGDGFADIVMQKDSLNRLGFYACGVNSGSVTTSYQTRSKNNLVGWTAFGIGDFDGNGEDDVLFNKDTNDKIRAYWGDAATSKDWNTFTFNAWALKGLWDLDGTDEDVIVMQKSDLTKIAVFRRDGSSLTYEEVNTSDWAGWELIVGH